jgi:hypothetical protein
MKFIESIKNTIKAFFSTDNSINENTVIGVAFVVALLFSTFSTGVDADKYYILAGLVAVCFGIGAFKK